MLLWFSAVSFLLYGIGCFTSAFMKEEFVRYGIPKLRKLIGVLQLLGSLGIIVGFRVEYLQPKHIRYLPFDVIWGHHSHCDQR